jgi:hypothetical protein
LGDSPFNSFEEAREYLKTIKWLVVNYWKD